MTSTCIYSSKANTVTGNLFILRFLVLPHLHRERCSWNFLRVRALLERSWKWCGRDLNAFLDAVNREIYLEQLIVLIKISIFGARYRFSYRMEKNRDISLYCPTPNTNVFIYTNSPNATTINILLARHVGCYQKAVFIRAY